VSLLLRHPILKNPKKYHFENLYEIVNAWKLSATQIITFNKNKNNGIAEI
jgi:hypothetical protein